MKVMIFVLILLTSLFSNVGMAQDSVQKTILNLESSIVDLQQQINQLKHDLGADVSEVNAKRIKNLETYAVQLNTVLSQLKEQVHENTAEVSRISSTEEKKPNLGIYGTLLVAKEKGQDSVIDGQSFEIILSGQPHKRLSYFMELEFERAAEVGGSRGGEVLLEQAYTDFVLSSWANFRGGILLVPFGNIERDHYAPLRDVISKPYTSYALAPSDWTDNGLGFNGKFNLSDNWLADFQTYLIAGLDNNINSTGLRSSRQGFGVDNNNNKAFAGKMKLQNTGGFSAGLSLYNGAWDDSDNRYITGLGANFDYQWQWLELVGDYTRMSVEREIQGSAIMDGYYLRSIVSIDKFLPENWLGEDFRSAMLQFVLQYDRVNIENFLDRTLADNWEKRFTVGVNLAPVSSWILKLNYENVTAGGPDKILWGNNDIWLFSMGYVF